MKVQIGDICSPFSGFTPAAADLYPSGKYPYFKVAEMNREANLKVMTETDAYVLESKKFFPKGAIVFPKNGAAIATNKKRILGQDSIVDLNTGGVKADTRLVDVVYLYYLFQHIDFAQYMRRGAVPTLDLKGILAQEIVLPTLAEQRSIVAELDLLSGIIEKKNAQLNTLDDLAVSLYYEMFGAETAKQSKWPQMAFKEVCSFYRGLTFAKPDEVSFSNKVVLRSNNVDLASHSLILDNDELKYLRDDFIIPAEKKIAKDTILMCMSNGSRQHVGKVAYIDKDYDYAFGGFMGLIKPNRICNPRYIFYSLLTTDFKSFLNVIGEGIGILNLKFSTLGDYSIAVPPTYLQEDFAKKVMAIENEKKNIKESITFASDLLASRMDKYFAQ